MIIWEFAAVVLLLNLPFGYWRANVGKMSAQWFFAIHVPVGLMIVMRVVSGIGWQWATLPLFVLAFFAGQLLGTSLHRWYSKRARTPVSSCLVMDALRIFQAGR